MDEGYGAKYADLYRRHWWWRAREEYLERLLLERLGPTPQGEVLDFGCGDGLFFPVLQRFGSPRGIEPEAKLLDPAGPWRDRISTEPLAASATEAGRFRLIVALDVLEHIAEPGPVMLELARRLAPGGWFVATVPAFQSLWTTHDDLNHHMKRYRADELAALVAAPGLAIVESRYLFVWLAFAKWGVVQLERFMRPSPRPPGVPAAPINGAVLALSRLEQRLLGHSPPPFGSSAIVVARRPG
jgi:2-polyprenyl-3-methyl-5-hydroxy-6-metoxy-1,4-benzoquinol methylase